LQIHNQVAILWSRDSLNAIGFLPFTPSRRQWSFAPATADYASLVQQIHRSLYDLNVDCEFVSSDTPDFSAYKLLIVPALYIEDDTFLQRISDYVKNGGHVVMTFKRKFANENSAVLGSCPRPTAPQCSCCCYDIAVIGSPAQFDCHLLSPLRAE
jgi:beta-galactosidase